MTAKKKRLSLLVLVIALGLLFTKPSIGEFISFTPSVTGYSYEETKGQFIHYKKSDWI